MLAQETRPLSPSNPEWVKKIPQPKFKLWEQVKHTWTSDDEIDKEMFGRTFTHYGVIAGCWLVGQEKGNNGVVWSWAYKVFMNYVVEQKPFPKITPVNQLFDLDVYDQDELEEIDLNPD